MKKMIRFINLSNSKALRKIVERNVRSWVHAALSLPEPENFEAVLTRVGPGHDFQADVTVVHGGKVWNARVEAPAPEHAIRLAMKSMRLVYVT